MTKSSIISELKKTNSITESVVADAAIKNKSKISALTKKAIKIDKLADVLKGPISDVYKLLVGKMAIKSSAEDYFSEWDESSWAEMSDKEKAITIRKYIDQEISFDKMRSRNKY